jgi:hypothetical protein
MNRTLFRPSRRAVLAVLCCLSATSPAVAQGYPDRPIRIVVVKQTGIPDRLIPNPGKR